MAASSRSSSSTQGLTIGEFGRRTGLSPKALRLYDLSDLLPPAAIDPFSGYRRYMPDQVERARRISLLRQIDMPLAVIADVLSGDDAEALVRIDRWWATQEASMDERRGSLVYLRARMMRANIDHIPHEVTLREIPATKLASISRVVDQQGLVDHIVSAGEELERFCREAGVTSTGGQWVLFHGLVMPDSEATVEVCAPFTGTMDPADRIVVRIEPAHTFAACTISRAECYYPQIMMAYDDVDAHIRTAGWPVTGVAREVYFANSNDVADDEPYVQIGAPVAVQARSDDAGR